MARLLWSRHIPNRKKIEFSTLYLWRWSKPEQKRFLKQPT